jgi:Protein of unknown function (DUF3619)
MNNTTYAATASHRRSSSLEEVLHDRQGLKIAAYLHESANSLPYETAERLRAARVQAVAIRKEARVQAAIMPMTAGSASLVLVDADTDSLGWWGRIGSALPLVALALGLLVINGLQNDDRARELADIDAALLTDELPPAAFVDRGFVQFLKENR